MTDQIFYTEGANNTFFLTFSVNLSFSELKAKALDLGLDPDGYIIAPKTGDNAVKFNFYNKDSSMVDFCGNALRAVGLCFFDQFGEKLVHLDTVVGEMKVEVMGENDVKAQMPSPKDMGNVDVKGISVPCILSGVPHLVFDLAALSLSFNQKSEIKIFCHEVRKMSLDDNKETFNLSFYELSNSHVDCVTFERGVEDFTEACGSGALSVFSALKEEHSKLKMPGGMLKINKKEDVYYMQGPASIMKRISL